MMRKFVLCFIFLALNGFSLAGAAASAFGQSESDRLLTFVDSVTVDERVKTFVVDPTGKFLFVGAGVSNEIKTFSIEPNGALTRVATFQDYGSTIDIAVDSTAKFAFVATNEVGHSDFVCAYTIGPKGELTYKDSRALYPVRSIAVDPTGSLVYATRHHPHRHPSFDELYAFPFDSTTGKFRHGNINVHTSFPMSIAASAKGRFAYLVSGDSVITYKINLKRGVLSPVSKVNAGRGPDYVAVHPTGEFVYVLNRDLNTEDFYNGVTVFSANTTEGTLTKVGTTKIETDHHNAQFMTIDPSGKLLLVALSDDNSTYVMAYSIDRTNGSLTFIAKSAAIGNIIRMAVSPSGEFVYVLQDNKVGVYAINLAAKIIPGK